VAYHASRAASLSNASEATTGFSDLFEKKDDIQVQAAIDDASAVPETPKDTFQTPKNTEFLKSEGGADAGMPVAETLRELLVEKQEATSNKKYKADKKKGTKGALLLVAAAGVLLLIAIFTLTPAAEQFGFSRNLIAAAQSTVKNSTKNLAGTLLPAEPAVEPTAAPASQPVEAPKAQKKTTPKKRQDVRPKDSNIPWVRTSSVTVSIADNRPSEPAPQVTSMNPGETTTDEVLAAAMTPLENHGMNVQARSQVVPSRLLESPAPKYPEMAEKAGITGEVDLGAVIGTDGKLKNIQVIKGHPLLNDAAIEAARGQRYSPYLLNSIPQEIPTRIRFVFKR
jgi:protein TonB